MNQLIKSGRERRHRHHILRTACLAVLYIINSIPQAGPDAKVKISALYLTVALTAPRV